jgi:subtilisin family serine protease
VPICDTAGLRATHLSDAATFGYLARSSPYRMVTMRQASVVHSRRWTRHALAAVILAALGASGTAQAQSAYGRLEPDQAAAARAAGIEIVQDYGGYLWARGDIAALRRLGSVDAARETEAFALGLGGRTFDPLVAYPISGETPRESGPTLRLLQFTAPPRQQWLDALAADGVKPVQYIAPNAYVVWADAGAIVRAPSTPMVRWVGEFLDAWRAPALTAAPWEGVRDVRATLYIPARVEDAALRDAGAIVSTRARIDAQFEIVRLVLDHAAFQRVLAMPGVYSVQPVPTNGGLRGEVGATISANLVDAMGAPQPGYRARLDLWGIDGTGVRIADVDGGIFDTHPDIVNRMVPCVGTTCGGSETDAHGTHTATIIAGDSTSGTLANGFRRGIGVAPGAKIVEQVYSPFFTQAGGMLLLMKESRANNAIASGNSWGPAGSPLGYDDDTRQTDVGVRDTDPTVAGDQSLIYVLSIMNGGGGTSSQGTPDEAKNCITVGSTNGESAAGVPKSLALRNSVSSNSAHGPALDGRRIPHLVAPGCSIDSAASLTGYQMMCGTSMASPNVTGGVALFTQHFRTLTGKDPSPAIAKAAVIASSQDLFGGTDADGVALAHRPDNKQGWGRMRTDRLLGKDVTIWYYDQQHVFDATGETWTKTFNAIDPLKPVQVMLVYTDAPGHGLGGSQAAWNNDLDLKVVTAGTTYRGNVFGADGYSTSGGAPDAKNNVEGVVIAPAAIGRKIVVTVDAININSNALPNSGDATDQDFAVLCANCLDTDPIFADDFEP